jgi:uncharacterized protein (DUF1810 family)
MKLRSSITLFLQVNPEDEVLMKVLNKFFEGEMDKYTLDIISK